MDNAPYCPENTVKLLFHYRMHVSFFFSFRPFPSQVWSQRIIILHIFLSSISVSFAPTSSIYFFTTSKNLLFVLPLFLFPGNSISIIFLPTYSWSLLMTCPYYLSLPSLIFIPNRSTLTVLLMCSFLILSFLVTPIANLSIFISATSISSTCFFVTATVSTPYTITGLTTELYTFSFTLAGNLLSQITPDTLLHPFHPACTLFFTSLSQPPLICTVDPKYLNSFTLGTFTSSIFTVSSSFPPFMQRYSVFDLLTFIPLLSNAYFQDFNLCSTSSLVSSQITISSANSIVHGGSLLTSSVSLSIITANGNGLNADPWCSPTLILKLYVVPTAHLTFVSLSSYISCTSCIYFFTILDFIMQYHSSSLESCRKVSLGQRIHNVALFDLPCIFPSTFAKQTWHRWFLFLA